MKCPCQSNQAFKECCEPYLKETELPKTPETLMRSRYSAYTLADMRYIKKTMQGKALLRFNEEEANASAAMVVWLGLKVLNSNTEADKGEVEFIASYLEEALVKKIHEVSEFIKQDGRWYYIDGKQINEPSIKVTRNMSCPCGSGKKFKHCHC